MDIYNYMLAIMDIHNSIMYIHNSIMDIHNWITDIHNYRVYAPLSFHMSQLTHWGRVTHICVSKIVIIGSDMACRLVGAKPLSEPMLEYC